MKHSRVLDDGMWTSSKLAKCAHWTIPEYAWLYLLADANGNFELTDLRTIYGQVYAIRPQFTFENLKETIAEFYYHGLLFVWHQHLQEVCRPGKVYGHWTGSERPGRLPSPSQRDHFPKFDGSPRFLPGTEAKLAEDAYLHAVEVGKEPPQSTCEVMPRHCLANVGLGVGVGFGFGIGIKIEREGSAQAMPRQKEPEPQLPHSLSKLGITLSQWKDFRDMRSRIGRPLSEGAIHLVYNELLTIMSNNQGDPVEVLNQAIQTSSFTLRPIKENNGTRKEYSRPRNAVAAVPGKKYRAPTRFD